LGVEETIPGTIFRRARGYFCKRVGESMQKGREGHIKQQFGHRDKKRHKLNMEGKGKSKDESQL
jgi:hypothetical protein